MMSGSVRPRELSQVVQVNYWSFLRTLSLCAAGNVTRDLPLSYGDNNLAWGSWVFGKNVKVKHKAPGIMKELLPFRVDPNVLDTLQSR
jgi:hypothetical protein